MHVSDAVLTRASNGRCYLLHIYLHYSLKNSSIGLSQQIFSDK